MEHIRLLWTGIMAEYLVMSTSQGTYDLRSNRTTVRRDQIYIWNVQSGESARTVIGNRWCSSLWYYALWAYVRSGGVALDGDCRECGTFAFSAIRLKLAFSQMSHYTFKVLYATGHWPLWWAGRLWWAPALGGSSRSEPPAGSPPDPSSCAGRNPSPGCPCWSSIHCRNKHSISTRGEDHTHLLLLTSAFMHSARIMQKQVWPWSTKPVIRVNFSKLRLIHHL